MAFKIELHAVLYIVSPLYYVVAVAADASVEKGCCCFSRETICVAHQSGAPTLRSVLTPCSLNESGCLDTGISYPGSALTSLSQVEGLLQKNEWGNIAPNSPRRVRIETFSSCHVPPAYHTRTVSVHNYPRADANALFSFCGALKDV